MDLAALTLTVAVVCGAVLGLRAGLRRLANQQLDGIDALIREKGARSVPGMQRPDWRVIDRVGALRWQETLAAQRAGQKSVAARQEARRRAQDRTRFRVV